MAVLVGAAVFVWVNVFGIFSYVDSAHLLKTKNPDPNYMGRDFFNVKSIGKLIPNNGHFIN
jgi:hypothetical protein